MARASSLEGVKMSINPFDEIGSKRPCASRNADTRRRSGGCVGIGADDVQQQLRTALAMGADRALILVKTAATIEPLQAARMLLKLAEQGAADARDARQAGHRRRQQPDRPDARGLWDRPQATFASKVELNGDNGAW
jgi:electron transfer flavoprotein beta subunit